MFFMFEVMGEVTEELEVTAGSQKAEASVLLRQALEPGTLNMFFMFEVMGEVTEGLEVAAGSQKAEASVLLRQALDKKTNLREQSRRFVFLYYAVAE